MMESLGNTVSEIGSADEEISLEDLVLSTMEKQGFLSDMKARIMKFVQENGNMEVGLRVIPSRANQEILQYMFEYLEWVGMRNTSSLLISESPVPIDASLNVNNTDPPRLCKLFENGGEKNNVSNLTEPEADVDESVKDNSNSYSEFDASKDLGNNTTEDVSLPDSKSFSSPHQVAVHHVIKDDEKLPDISGNNIVGENVDDSNADAERLSKLFVNVTLQDNIPKLPMPEADVGESVKDKSNSHSACDGSNNLTNATWDISILDSKSKNFVSYNRQDEAPHNISKDDKNLSDTSASITAENSAVADETVDLGSKADPPKPCELFANVGEEDNASKLAEAEATSVDEFQKDNSNSYSEFEGPKDLGNSTTDRSLPDSKSNNLISCNNLVEVPHLPKDDEELSDISLSTLAEKSTIDETHDDSNSLISCMNELNLNSSP